MQKLNEQRQIPKIQSHFYSHYWIQLSVICKFAWETIAKRITNPLTASSVHNHHTHTHTSHHFPNTDLLHKMCLELSQRSSEWRIKRRIKKKGQLEKGRRKKQGYTVMSNSPCSLQSKRKVCLTVATVAMRKYLSLNIIHSKNSPASREQKVLHWSHNENESSLTCPDHSLFEKSFWFSKNFARIARQLLFY